MEFSRQNYKSIMLHTADKYLKWKRKDIPTEAVLKACQQFHSKNSFLNRKAPWKFLLEEFKAPVNVIYSAMERDFNKGYLEYGVSLRTSWLTKEGEQFLKERENEKIKN